MNTIFPCFWFNGKTKEASNFYSSIFENYKIISESGNVIYFDIDGFKIMLLDGGPMFSITPSISLFVNCVTEAEIDLKYKQLVEGGTVMMALDKYPFAEKYAWVKDKYGITWQLMLGNTPVESAKIKPAFLFVGNQYGNALKAIQDYTKLFPKGLITNQQLYGNYMPEHMQGKLMFSQFKINNTDFIAMDGPGDHVYTFTEGVSLTVECDTQAEIDLYWNTLTAEGQESNCGWLKDKYGVSWQIIPSTLKTLMSNPATAQKTVDAFMQMKKFEIDKLPSIL